MLYIDIIQQLVYYIECSVYTVQFSSKKHYRPQLPPPPSIAIGGLLSSCLQFHMKSSMSELLDYILFMKSNKMYFTKKFLT